MQFYYEKLNDNDFSSYEEVSVAKPKATLTVELKPKENPKQAA